MKTFYVYILLCSDGTYYTGMTSVIESRFTQHQKAKYPNSYTASRLPVELMYFTSFNSFKVAIAKERQLKKWSTVKKLALIECRFEDLPNLAKKKF